MPGVSPKYYTEITGAHLPLAYEGWMPHAMDIPYFETPPPWHPEFYNQPILERHFPLHRDWTLSAFSDPLPHAQIYHVPHFASPKPPESPTSYHRVVTETQTILDELTDSTLLGNLGESYKHLTTMQAHLERIHDIIIDTVTNYGTSPYLAGERIIDMMSQRVRSISRLRRQLTEATQLGFIEKPDAEAIWQDFLEVLQIQNSPDRQEALRAFEEKYAGLQYTDANGVTQKASLKIPPALPDLYSCAVYLPFTSWNHTSKAGATSNKNPTHAFINAFIASGQSVEDFLARPDLAEFVIDPPANRNSCVTVANHTLIGILTEDISHMTPFLERFTEVYDKIMLSLIAKREELSGIATPDGNQRKQLRKILRLTRPFKIDPDHALVFVHDDGKVIPVSEFDFKSLLAGVSVYSGSDNLYMTPEGYRNPSAIHLAARALRDGAISAVEGLHKKMDLEGRMPDEADRVAFEDPTGTMQMKKVYREGSILNAEKVYDGLLAIKYPAPALLADSPRLKTYRIVSEDDLNEAALDAATQLIAFQTSGKKPAYPRHFAISTEGFTAEQLASSWMEAFRATGKLATRPKLMEFIHALQWSFTRPFKSHKLLALYMAFGGQVQPLRLLRHIINSKGERDLIVRISNALEKMSLILERNVQYSTMYDYYLPDDLTTEINQILWDFKEAAGLIIQAARHPKDDRSVATFEELGPTVLDSFRAYYLDMQKRGITPQGARPGLYHISFEVRSARALDSEANPVDEDYEIDTNADMVRISTHEMIQDEFTKFIQLKYGPDVSIVNEEWPQADEKDPVIPRHLSNGVEMDDALLAEFAEFQQQVLGELLPFDLHIEHKITEIIDGTSTQLRPKRWTIQTADGKTLLVAASKDFNPNGDNPLWIMSENGIFLEAERKVSANEIAITSCEPVLGKVKARLVAVPMDLPEIPLEDTLSEQQVEEFNAGFMKWGLIAFELDEAAKKKEKEGYDPTEGIWVYDKVTREIRQVKKKAA